MNRLSFLKKLGIGVATLVVAPKMIAEKTISSKPAIVDNKPVIPKEFESIDVTDWKLPEVEEIMRIWRQTGFLIYKP
jgi:hypothetical protein